MPTKKPRAQKLESASARRKLSIAKRPVYVKIAPNIRLGYRRNAGPGTWSVRVTGPGIDWVKRIGLADDQEPADGRAVLNYWQAIDQARKLARRQPGDDIDDTRPLTVGEAIELYARDLAARGGDDYNAKRSRLHLPASILTKPVALLRAAELCKWREGLIEKGLARATVNRVRTCVRAALTLAAKRDKRITNRHVWEENLEALPNATMARNVVLADDAVGRLITAAYGHDRQLGLLCDVVSTTGARPSQVVRLLVADLDLADRSAPRLMVPRSGKGHAHKRAAKMAERVPVPITAELAASLKAEAVGRAGDAPLLRRADGSAWGYRRSDQYRRDFAVVVEAVGLDPKTVTAYALRHSHISRSLLRGVPVTLVADLTDTSEREIRKHYAKLISHHADDIARRALLQIEQPAADNIVALSGRRS
jgi:integrase